LFEGFTVALWLKRWRCPGCKIVITVRPQGFFSRIQSTTTNIYQALKTKLDSARWPLGLPRQRAGHWLRRFIFFVRINYGDDNGGVSLAARLADLFTREVKFLVELA